MKYYISFLLILVSTYCIKGQQVKVLQSDESKLKLEVNFSGVYSVADTVIEGRNFNIIRGKNVFLSETGKPWLPRTSFSFGMPLNSKPALRILNSETETFKNKFILPFPKDDPASAKIDLNNFDAEVYNADNFYPENQVFIGEPYLMRFARAASLVLSPFRFNPVTRDLVFTKKILIEITFNTSSNTPFERINDTATEQFIRDNLINAAAADKWMGRPGKNISLKKSGGYWYDPNKDYYKLYLKNDGLYRVTYEYLAEAGVPVLNVPVTDLELLNYGEHVPVYVTDKDNNGLFNDGDYFEFAGGAPHPSQYAKINIYNLSNVYWFSYQGNSEGTFYHVKNGYPENYNSTYINSKVTLHLEQDQIYERLGYAPDEKRDYWFWGSASAQNGTPLQQFETRFNGFKDFDTDSLFVTVRVDMHGMTNYYACSTDHRAYVYINNKLLGSIDWNGQTAATFEKRFMVSADSVNIYPEGNILKVMVKGDACPSAASDEIRINWVEFDYWRLNRTGDYYAFKTDSTTNGILRFWSWKWKSGNVKIFSPENAELINNYVFAPSQDNTIVFTDTLSGQKSYYMADESYIPALPDSIRKDNPSNLRNLSNRADYIIITHKDFLQVAEKLKEFRQNNFPDSTIPDPHILIADVNEIYDEFSYGLLDPFALRDFVKYAYENYQQPAPAYVVLLGDMSYDYRHLLASSRQNYVPSIPVHVSSGVTLVYGQAVSDNSIVAVSGDDAIPDLAIGRLSIETVDEGNVLLDKLMNYPADASKEWKQNVLLISSGIDALDEAYFNFNDENVYLEQTNIKPLGISTTKVFRYPNKSEYEQYRGEGPEIRNAFNKGAVLANYYGHGGGYQWDLVFLNDDIYLLNNGNKLPVITSTTCYTAHFDNQDVFGEQFIKVPGKGAIGFISSSGLTLWNAGKLFDMLIYQQIFNNRMYIVGKAIQNASNGYLFSIEEFRKQYAMFTYLGDPVLKLALPEKPDFEIKPEDISFNPAGPVTEAPLEVKVRIKNLGIAFSDSVLVHVNGVSPDSSFTIGEIKVPGFGDIDSVSFTWVPLSAGTYDITVKINDDLHIEEDDHSDNAASASVSVFSLSEPSILQPENALTTKENYINFRFSDIGYYVDKSLTYEIEIDTSEAFMSPFLKSGMLQPANGLLEWKSPVLAQGEYFWRTRLFDGQTSSNWSSVRGFIISPASQSKFNWQGKLLQLFSTYNMNYSSEGNALVLNTEWLPPRPDKKRFIENIRYDFQSVENNGLTAITTDGSYIYFANIWYYSLQNNPQGYSAIHRVGTGNNGTVKGMLYEDIPQFSYSIKNSIFYHSDGFLYAAAGDSHTLLKINPVTGATVAINIPAGLLDAESGRVQDGSFYLASDGRYVYNLTFKDTLGRSKYMLRVFDPSNNWSTVQPDMILTGSSYPGFSSFFVADGYLYPIEYFTSNFIRRIRLSDGLFEEEWFMNEPFRSYYSITYDWTHNEIYASVYRGSGYEPMFGKFAGRYIDASGSITSGQVGPALKWNSLSYKIEDTGTTANYTVSLSGFNSLTRKWTEINKVVSSTFDLSGINAKEYPLLQVNVTITDSTSGVKSPVKFTQLSVDYETLPEPVVTNNLISFHPDTLLQGYTTTVSAGIKNAGGSNADSVKVKLYLNESETAFFDSTVSIKKDSITYVTHDIPTAALLFDNNVKSVITSPSEYYTYNNSGRNSFYVARDSIRPLFSITFDGIELVDGDIVSSSPEVLITLEDNSPLPIDTSYFTVLHNNLPLSFSDPDVKYTYSAFPESKLTIKWTPKLQDGEHSVEVLARDASGNFFDSTSYRTEFLVYSNDGLLDVYNYPNPFKGDTWFTFELSGNEVPDQFLIKIYTIAGRLIRDISIPPADLRIGFNKFYWDGRDQDGDDIANGLYLYKIIYRHNGHALTETKKLVKMR